MKVYLYEWYVSRITYINSDIVWRKYIWNISLCICYMNVYSLPYDVFVCMHSPCLCVREWHVFILQIVFDCNWFMKGVISYFPSPGGVLYIVSMCIPSEQEFGGSVEAVEFAGVLFELWVFLVFVWHTERLYLQRIIE